MCLSISAIIHEEVVFMRLKIELVPKTSWGNNLRSDANLKTSEWDKLRKACYAKASHRCEICNGVGRNHPVECHEIWEYDDENHIQKLMGLIALCPLCHKAKHLGRTLSIGDDPARVLIHLSKVNELDDAQLAAYIQGVFNVWTDRSRFEWTLDLSWLKDNL